MDEEQAQYASWEERIEAVREWFEGQGLERLDGEDELPDDLVFDVAQNNGVESDETLEAYGERIGDALLKLLKQREDGKPNRLDAIGRRIHKDRLEEIRAAQEKEAEKLAAKSRERHDALRKEQREAKEKRARELKAERKRLVDEMKTKKEKRLLTPNG